tara:strand:+ start:28025 stop:28384 length:360 start_codon:yes stop_codon:yes gene_type:complete
MSGLVLLAAVTSTGASLAKEFSRLVDKHALQVTITGAPTAVTVTLEGSLDGTTFSTIGTHAMSAGELTATKALYFDIDMPVLYVKANLTVLTAGTAPTVTVTYEGDSTGKQKVSRRGTF